MRIAQYLFQMEVSLKISNNYFQFAGKGNLTYNIMSEIFHHACFGTSII